MTSCERSLIFQIITTTSGNDCCMFFTNNLVLANWNLYKGTDLSEQYDISYEDIHCLL